MILSELRTKEYFTRKPYTTPKENQVWVKDSYDRSTKKYTCYNFADINRRIQLKGSTLIYTDFIF